MKNEDNLIMSFIMMERLLPFVFVILRTTISAPECKTTELGTDYNGFLNKTLSNWICDRWDIYGISIAPENYCRNPIPSQFEGPWCYTTDPSTEWEYCDIPFCTPQCKTTYLGEEYDGEVAKTRTGRRCQRWDVDYPHWSGWHAGPENYCRNSDATDGGPWCYTMDSTQRWELCNIPYCSPNVSTSTTKTTEFESNISLTTQYGSTFLTTKELGSTLPTTTEIVTASQTTIECGSNACQCFCPCSKVQNRWNYLLHSNLTYSEIKEEMKMYLEKMVGDLTIDKKNTSIAVRRRTSARDDRLSSLNLGIFGVIVVCMTICFFVIIDCTNYAKLTKISPSPHQAQG